MENEDFRGAALFDHFAQHARSGAGDADLTLAARNRQNVAKLYLSVFVGLRFEPNHVSGRHPVLFTTGADDRVHTHASH